MRRYFAPTTNRAREARESKSLRAKMHTMAESMHSMMRECEDAKVASRNTVHAFSCLVSRLGLFDRTPFRVAKTGSSTKGRENDIEENTVAFELQDCSLGDDGALAVAGALNAFVTREAEKQSAVKNVRVNPHHKAVLQHALKGDIESNAEICSSPSGGESRSQHQAATVKPMIDDLISLRRHPVRIAVDLSFNDITDANDSAG